MIILLYYYITITDQNEALSIISCSDGFVNFNTSSYHSAGKHYRGPLYPLFFYTLFPFRLFKSRSAGSILIQNIISEW